MIRKAVQITLLIALVAGVGYIGVSVYANCVVFRQAALGPSVQTPDIDDARYSIEIVNTGRTLYADEYSQEGAVYLIPSYWEERKGEYVYRQHALRLDETVFGAILVVRR